MAYNPYLHGFEPINYTPNNMFGVTNTNAANNFNTQVVDLSKGQMKVLDNPAIKYNIQENKDYDSILNDAGFRAQDIEGKPPTKQNIIDYYQGTYKPSASLNTLSNNRYVDAGTVMNDASLFSHANAAPINNTELEKGMTFGNRISSIAQDPMELYRTGMSRRDYAPDPNSVATRNSFIHNKYGLPEYQGELTGIPHRGDMSGRANLQEFGTEHFPIAPDKKRNFSFPTFSLSGILQGLKNQFKINPEKQKEFDSWEENKNQKGWGSIGDTGLKGNIYEGPGGKKFSLVDPTTGYNVLQNKNWRGGTGNSLREQINLKNAWIADRLFRGKRLGKKADAYAKLNKLGIYADQETFTRPPGGGPLNEPGGEWVGGAPAYTHQGIGGGEYTNEIGNVEYQDPYDPGGGEAAGGLMRIHSRGRYSKGGRVGILSVF